MKNILKNKSFIAAGTHIFVPLILIIIFIFSSCSAAVSADNTDNAADMAQPEISVISFELKDLNGGDIYPGEEMAAVLRIKNSGRANAENISIELVLSAALLPANNDENNESEKSSSAGAQNPEVTISGSNAEIDRLAPGKEITVEIPLEVAGDIKQDITDKLGFTANDKSNGKPLTGELSFTVFGVAPYERDEIPIIGLHAIEDKIEIPIELSTYNFDILCRTLKNFGFETITFTDLLNHVQFGRVIPEKSVIITSDDGFGDLYSNAFDVLKKYDYKMTVFLVTDFIKDTDSQRVTNYFDSDRPVPMRPMLIWPEVKEMDEYGCEFLSHSANHIRLGLATEEEFRAELSKSKKDIEKHLGKPVVFFAWPYDNNDPEKLKFLPELGYTGAIRYWGGLETVSTLDLKEIKRVEFNSLISPQTYATYLNLHSVAIEGKLEKTEIKKGEEFILEYIIKNKDEADLEISSMELELPDWISLEGTGDQSYIMQYPGFKDGIFMWVSDEYAVGAESQIVMKLRLAADRSGEGTVKFRISAYNGYIEADDLEVKIN